MPRVPDLGITLGLLPPGPTGSVLDVPGTGLGHAIEAVNSPSGVTHVTLSRR